MKHVAQCVEGVKHVNRIVVLDVVIGTPSFQLVRQKTRRVYMLLRACSR